MKIYSGGAVIGDLNEQTLHLVSNDARLNRAYNKLRVKGMTILGPSRATTERVKADQQYRVPVTPATLGILAKEFEKLNYDVKMDYEQ